MKNLMVCIFFLLSVFFTFALSAQTLEPFIPDDPLFFHNSKDPQYSEFPGQWHLENKTPGTKIDANLRGAWDLGYTGKGIVIGIVDDGVEGNHEDIAENYNSKLSRTFLGDEIKEEQKPVFLNNNHGTAVAGVAAARGKNNIGGTGAAPYAEIAGLRLLDTNKIDPKYKSPSTNNDDFNAFMWKSGVVYNTATKKFTIQASPEIHIKNHSYGPSTPFAQDDTEFKEIMTQALRKTAENGVIHVFAAGNDRNSSNEDSNKSFGNNSSDVINVAAIGSDGKFSDYSSYGSNVFVAAPSSSNTGFSITTTDRTGDNFGYNEYSDNNKCGVNGADCGDSEDNFPNTNYTSTFGGTSSSAPLVSGIMALGKEVNKYMDVRMAKHILVQTSAKVDTNNKGWIKNGAGNSFNPNYGFGNINAGEFVKRLKTVKGVTIQSSYSTGTHNVNETIKYIDNTGMGGTSKSFKLATTAFDETTASKKRQPLEGVEVTLNFSHTKRGDLTASIVSPYLKKSIFLNSTSNLPTEKQDTENVTNFSWTFLTNTFWGEDPLGGTDKNSGTWTVTMGDTVNKAIDKLGTWNSYAVTFLMGKLIFNEAGTTTQTEDISARSISLNSLDELFINPSGKTLEVSEKVQVSKGELKVNGVLKMVRPEDDDDEGEFILDGGILSGGGIIVAPYGFYHFSGDIKPGNSIGTLTINGDYYQDTAAKLIAEIASTTSNDLLVINGGADIQGTLETIWTGGYIPAAKTKFGAIITASSGITGQFLHLITNITPTLLFKPAYDLPNQVYLVVERDYNNDKLIHYLTTNQRSIGSMLNSVGNTATGDLNTILTKIDSLTSYNQTANALDQLAPRGTEAQYAMAISATTFQGTNISDRLSELRQGVQGISTSGLSLRQGTKLVMLASADSDLRRIIPSNMNDRWGFFIKGDAVMGNQRDVSDYLGYDFTTAGITLGSDYRFTKNFVAGIMAGISNSRGTIDNYDSKVKIDNYTFGFYGTYYKNNFFIDSQINYGFLRYDNTRRIVFPGVDRTALSRPHGNQFNLFGGTGYDFRIKKWILTPGMSFQYTKLGIDGYSERGAGAANLDLDKQNIESLQGTGGIKLSYTLQKEKFLIMPFIRASYSYEFLRNNGSVTGQFSQGSSPFSIETASPDQNSFYLGTGITAMTRKDLSLFINYGIQIGENKYASQNINAGIRIQF